MFLHDLRYAARGLRRNPGLVIIVVLSLGLGIGVNITLFNLFNLVVLEKPTAFQPERLIRIEPGNGNRISYLNYRDMRSNNAFADLALRMETVMSGREDAVVEKITTLQVSGNYFRLLGAKTMLGRTFDTEESVPERDPRVAVIDWEFWQHKLGADPSVLGRVIHLNDRPVTVIGVLPRSFRSGMGALMPEVYLPLSPATSPFLEDRGRPAFEMIARLAPGASREQAQAAFTLHGESSRNGVSGGEP